MTRAPDFEGLAQRISTLWASFSEHERQILSCCLTIAGHDIEDLFMSCKSDPYKGAFLCAFLELAHRRFRAN